ncbi:MAG TPA: hypothetical protein VGF28_05380 [Thermoanaerobaculia bacterium]|jgi:hypothetical protein
MMQVFEVVRTLELDVPFGDRAESIRVEISRGRAVPALYRARVFRLDFYRIQPSFGRSEGADEQVLVDWSDILRRYTEQFAAPSLDEAEQLILGELEAWHRHASGTCGAAEHTWGECAPPPRD